MKILWVIIIATFFSGCQQAVTGTQGSHNTFGDTQGESAKRKWTVVIYMAADNDLESAALADLNELEGVLFAGKPVSILVLLDRHNAYDMTNGNWSDTRLFEVSADPNGVNASIVSQRLDCPDLGLSKNTETELNMADPLVLKRLIDFSKREYPAENYALFIWGHGTGWRGPSSPDSLPLPLKAIAIDDTSAHYMTLPAFGQAVAGRGLSLIAFDTCFAALLEVAYQIRNDAQLLAGSEGAIMATGWDYTALFSTFLQKPDLSLSDLGNAIQDQFSAQYAALDKAAISQIKLSEVNDLFIAFNDFAGIIASSLVAEPAKNAVLYELLNNVESYYFASFPADLYIDIFDFTQKMAALRTSITADPTRQNAILAAADALRAALTAAVPASWAKNGSAHKIGVHVIPLQGPAVPDAAHEGAYIKGSMALGKSAFVENSAHWAPNYVPQSDSLLDKLFYCTY
jgi:hypothetical protein